MNQILNGKSYGRGRILCSQTSLANRQKLSTIGDLNNETKRDYNLSNKNYTFK
jgi:hypothetical protein